MLCAVKQTQSEDPCNRQTRNTDRSDTHSRQTVRPHSTNFRLIEQTHRVRSGDFTFQLTLVLNYFKRKFLFLLLSAILMHFSAILMYFSATLKYF